MTRARPHAALCLALAALLCALPSFAPTAYAQAEAAQGDQAGAAAPFDDVDASGPCASDAAHFCKKVTAGGGALSECLTNQLADEKAGKAEGRRLSKDCKKDLRTFKVERAKSFVKDTKLFDACKKEALKFCNSSDLFPEPGSVLSCLRTHIDELGSSCTKQVHRTMEQSSDDLKLDAKLNEKCSADAESLCADVEPGEGRIQTCLRKRRASLSWDCQEELFRQEVENSGDFRLNAELRQACMADSKKFCADIKPGNARVKDCLEDNREKAEFSSECKAKFEDMMARRATDFRLDAKLTKLCASDIENVCGYEKDSLDSIAGWDGRVVECLQDYKDELSTPACQKRVHKLTVRASQDIRMDEPLWDACFDDRAQLCPDVPSGSSRILRCLQDQREKLSYECRATLFDQEVRFAESLDFHQPMKKACAAEATKWCKDVPEGHMRLIECLRSHDSDEEMSTECKKEVKRDEIRSAQDYRLNFRLNKACDADIDALCFSACSPFMGQACGGAVLRCLQTKQANVTSEACKKSIFEIEKGESDDWRRDAILKEACKADVEKFCADKEAGAGRIHRCLRDHAADLSDECKKEELTLSIVQSQDVRLMPQLRVACVDEMKQYCKDVPPGGQRVLKCLQENVKQPDFGGACLKEVDIATKRSARNYKLDFGITKQCAADIKERCTDVPSEGRAKVIKCLLGGFSEITDGCQHEVSRAIKMAMVMYHKGAPLTMECDADVADYCTTPKRASSSRPGFTALGANLKCLSKRIADEKSLSPECKNLLSISSSVPTSELVKGGAISAKALAKEVIAMERKEFKGSAAGDDSSFITLTGWVALVAITALCVVMVGLAIFLVRKYRSPQRTVYTAVKDGGV
jgi:Golgi apparatus protein 1